MSSKNYRNRLSKPVGSGYNTSPKGDTQFITMTTSTTAKPNKNKVETIEVIEDNVMFITNEATAKELLKRNPRAVVTKGEEGDDRFAVVYRLSECNLINGVKRAR